MQLIAQYFRQHMYTMVPRQLREDFKWMADNGTSGISVALLEQDLTAARANLDIYFAEAERAGLGIYALPSRWGGVIAGSPKVPSLFAATHPHTWILGRDGRPLFSAAWGPMCSVHHHEFRDFFRDMLQGFLKTWPFAGLVWDEPKTLRTEDCSPSARKHLGNAAPVDRHTDAVASFFDEMGQHAKSVRPGVNVCLFMYADIAGYPSKRFAQIKSLDCFGCDGRPWSRTDNAPDHADERTKTLLDDAPAFLKLARDNGKKGFVLVENHNMSAECLPVMDRRLPDVMALKPDLLLYYYYPRNIPNPDEAMAIIARHLKAAAR